MNRLGDFVGLRRFTLLLAFLGGAALVLVGLFRAVALLEIRDVEVRLDLIQELDAGLAPLHQVAPEADDWQVGVLGDSMVISYAPRNQLPTRLQEALDSLLLPDPSWMRVHSLASPGMGPFDFYFVADRVADARPDQIILPVNLAALSESWRDTFSRPQLAGLLPPGRLLQAVSLPLEEIGVSADRLLSYIAVVQAGAIGPWRDLSARQAQLALARGRLADWLSTHFGSQAEKRFAVDLYRYHGARTVVHGLRPRLSAYGVEERFGPALQGVGPGFPALALLGASIRSFRERGIEVLVYVSPLNLRHIEAIGADNPEGLARTLTSIESVARRAGAGFMDLHELLPDAGFRDFAGHLSTTDAIDGPQQIATRIAPWIVETARRARASRD
jgi:hypothetical protein